MEKLEKYGVQEMNAVEMREVKGGGFFGALLGFVVGAVVGLFSSSGEVCGTDENGKKVCVPIDDSTDRMWIFGIIGAALGSRLPF